MNEPDSFDLLLKERFDREHQHVPAEPFMTAARQRINLERRRRSGMATALRAAALVAAVIASPWLIAGSKWLNATLASSLSLAGLPGTWVLGLVATVVLLVFRVRSR